jgi:Cys-rich four helix bundle protein (predicted Tat secretion target)
MTRRDVLLASAALAATATAATASSAGEHDAHAATAKYSEAKAFKKHAALVATANECLATGQECISHCFETFVAGDTTMAECAFAVEQMLKACDAFSYLAAYDSPHLPAMARVCVSVCEDCERECRKHEDHQAECKACADACAALIRDAKKLSG